jgi:hypothetical protein
MKHKLLVNVMTAAVLMVLVTGCSTVQNSAPRQQDTVQASSDDLNRSKPQELPDEIEDLQRIPQDVRKFAESIHSPLTSDEQARAVKDFRDRFFSPWTAKEPIYSIKDSIKGMNEVADTTWYGENRLKVAPERIKSIIAHATLDRLPSLNQLGIAIVPTFMRGLPNAKPLYETADDFPFDQLQYSEVKQHEPLRILHESDTGAWVFVETSYGQGWVRSGTVLPADSSVRQLLSSAELVVIVMDFAVIRYEKGKAMPQPKIGTLYPLIKEEADYWLVNVVVAGEQDQAVMKTAHIAKKDARRFPLTFDKATVIHVGNELMKTPYGWGELFRDRDCSATTRDFFMPFGIWLPRNSMQQLNLGPFVSLTNLSKPEKEKLLREQGVPFRTLVHRKGHIMLYAGLIGDKPVVMHNTWAIRFKTKSGKEEKFYVGRTVLTTLEVGNELPLSRGTHLDHIDGILTLPTANLLK